MANYTVRDVREVIEGLDGSVGLFGFVMSRADISVPTEDGPREPTPAEWEKIVTRADELAQWGNQGVWDALWEVMNDAVAEVCPDEYGDSDVGYESVLDRLEAYESNEGFGGIGI